MAVSWFTKRKGNRMESPGDALERRPTHLRSGQEPFRAGGMEMGITLLDFWRWSASALVNNTTRGVLAEFIVGTALGISVNNPRETWAPWDLTTPEGIKVEVKSAAYVQSWTQKRLSNITFNTPKTRTWDPETQRPSRHVKRQAEVYVFALLAHQDKVTIDPMNLEQWRFFVLPTSVLDGRSRSRDSITLSTLQKLHGPSQHYGKLREMVLLARAQRVDKAD